MCVLNDFSPSRENNTIDNEYVMLEFIQANDTFLK